ncbi:MAG: hypothetical protein IT336_09005 [Thermomicrobiales bacterium]|nr:hypothetical protein [Thermomicrobiales bacterium]
MSHPNATIVPRRRRDETPPAAPLDPFVTDVIRWIDAHEKRLNPNTLVKQVATNFAWQAPFAEAVITAVRARRLLTLVPVNSRGGYGVGLSTRGQQWLEQSAEPISQRS